MQFNLKKLSQGGIVLNKVKKHERLYENLKDGVFFFFGCAIYSVSVAVFTAPNRIAPGGVTGISTILHYLFGTPIGVMIFVLNIPLLILGLRLIGGRFIVTSIICTALISAFTDLMVFLPQYKGNMLLASIYGGVLSGVGLGLVFLRGSTTGGTDIASRLLRLKYRHIPMGRMMMIIDCVIVLCSAFAFKSVDDALYAMICIFTSSRVIDGILYGSDNGRMVLVVSDKVQEIANTILDDLNRGVTLLKGKGFYTGRERDVLMCAVRRPEAARLRTIVRRADPTAFIIMCEAGEVIGEGFKPITKDD